MYVLPEIDDDTPVIAAYGAGLDSTAMIIEWLAQGRRLDVVLFADTGGENPHTYVLLEQFTSWLAERRVPLCVVKYRPRRFKNWPEYHDLFSNCVTNGTLPGIAFGGGSCSLKWKVAPQHTWTKTWPPAIAAWAAGKRVVKLIGYDASPADSRRYARAVTIDDPHYLNIYPLRAWGWTRAECDRRASDAGFENIKKSACYFCSASRPEEIDALDPVYLRRIILMEARAKPRLRNIEGLWRTGVKGARGATPRPGSMTQYIRDKELLPPAEIDAVADLAPLDLVAFQATVDPNAETRPAMRQWLTLFDASHTPAFQAVGARPLYADQVAREPRKLCHV